MYIVIMVDMHVTRALILVDCCYTTPGQLTHICFSPELEGTAACVCMHGAMSLDLICRAGRG